MPTHLFKAANALWTIAMGAFLGLTGGLVVAIIVIFRGAEDIAASPGIAPYNDPMFTAFSHQAVAGYTGQMLFKIGGIAALALLGLAVLTLTIRTLLMIGRPGVGSRGAGLARAVALAGAVGFMALGSAVTLKINASWPGLYDTAASQQEMDTRRADFDQLHRRSERVVTIAWLCGLVALGVSPWCREPTPTNATAISQ
ncbi:hypothetical protein OT109_04990 [Phycisphaeraceae bacterium D3-23]